LRPFPVAVAAKPGSATRPFFDSAGGSEQAGPSRFRPVMEACWSSASLASMARTVYGDPERYRKTYWSDVPGSYFTGDGARQDADGYSG